LLDLEGNSKPELKKVGQIFADHLHVGACPGACSTPFLLLLLVWTQQVKRSTILLGLKLFHFLAAAAFAEKVFPEAKAFIGERRAKRRCKEERLFGLAHWGCCLVIDRRESRLFSEKKTEIVSTKSNMFLLLPRRKWVN
jgi:hypothetical protein